jgi:hypothetical protein
VEPSLLLTGAIRTAEEDVEVEEETGEETELELDVELLAIEVEELLWACEVAEVVPLPPLVT